MSAPASLAIGSIRVSRLVEAPANPLPLALFPRADESRFADRRGRFEGRWTDDDGTPVISISGFVLSVGDLHILVDTCVGNWCIPGIQQEGDSPYLRRLAEAGYQPGDIDVVVCTHMHLDHVGWNTSLLDDGSIVPTFPEATYLFVEEECRNARAALEAGSDPALATFDRTVEPLFTSGRVRLVDPDHQICKGVTLLPTPGHTPGHVSVRVVSGDVEAVITGDMVHHPVQLTEPDWAIAFDADPDLSTVTREQMISEWLRRDVLILGTHFPDLGVGRLFRDSDGVRFRPMHDR